MTTFFSVDVETSALDPWTGHLLTVGIQPVCWTPGARPFMTPDKLYVRIDREESLAISGWDNPDNPSDTYQWYMKQESIVADEAWRNPTLVRHDPETAARMIAEFCLEIEADPKERVFVANPVSFDKMWLEELFATTGVTNPFHYQTLCLRSMKFGIRQASPWGMTRDNERPLIPHHAFHDAYAQALDLVAMLAERDGIAATAETVAA